MCNAIGTDYLVFSLGKKLTRQNLVMWQRGLLRRFAKPKGRENGPVSSNLTITASILTTVVELFSFGE
jgi:hypothetical protein